ncbi:MAG: alpha/beta fold hydrolase [Nitrospinota bacterium]
MTGEPEKKKAVLLFVHGWGLSSSVWEKQDTFFGDTFSVLRMDLRGHGAARNMRGPYHIKAFRDDLKNTLERFQNTKIILVGSSLGAMVVLSFVLKFPGTAQGAVLIGATPCFLKKEGFDCGVPQVVTSRLRNQLEQDCQKRMEGFYGQLLSPEEKKTVQCTEKQKDLYIKPFYPSLKVLLDTLGEIEKWDIRKRLNEILLPVLIVHGERDPLFDRKCARELCKIKKSTVKFIPDAGHLPFLTAAEPVNRAIKNFLFSL